MLRNGDGVEGVVEVAADLFQIKSPHHPTEDHVEQLQALCEMHHSHQGDADGDPSPISWANTRAGQGLREESSRYDTIQPHACHVVYLFCDLIREKQCSPIKGTCFAKEMLLFTKQLESHVLALNGRPAGARDCGV